MSCLDSIDLGIVVDRDQVDDAWPMLARSRRRSARSRRSCRPSRGRLDKKFRHD